MKYQQLTRLFVPDSLENDTITLSSLPEVHYLANVMRKKLKDQLLVFNQKDGEYLAEIAEINHKKILLKLIEHVRCIKAEPIINLIFAPIKQARIAFLLEKATELGVSNLIPIQTQHSVVDKINLQKWQAYIKEAAEQCGRLSLPIISPLETIIKFLGHWPIEQEIILCNETEHALHISQYLSLTKVNKPISIMVGPEGGFSTAELTMLATKDFITSVHLGERILRAETASLAALAVAGGFLYKK